MDDLDNYKPSGLRRDLLHIVSCYYADQVSPVTLGSRQWEEESQAFIDAMERRRTQEWLNIKEVNPLDFMGYVAAIFKEVTGHYLRDLSSYIIRRWHSSVNLTAVTTSEVYHHLKVQ